MKELLNLNLRTLRTGRARSPFDDTSGIWQNAQGLNPYIESDTYRGLMALSHAPTDLTGSVIVDIPVAYCKDERGSTYNLYMMGLSGHFYSVTVNEVVTDLRSGTPINAPANGMAIYQPRAAAAPTLLFARETRIGTWDLSGTYATGWSDTTYNPGTTTVHRPFHRLFDRLYYGNKQYVGSFTDDGTATIVHTTQALNLDGQDTVTALGDDGRYLVIATTRTITESYNGLGRTRILFWDTSKSTWDWETTIPNETAIRAIKQVGGTVYAVGKRGVYTLAFGSDPRLLYAFDSDETVAYDPTNYNHAQSIAAWGDGVIFGKLATAVSKFLPGAQRAVFNPLQGFTGDIGLIIPDFLENKTHITTRSSKFYSIPMDTSGTSATPIVTRSISLGGKASISRILIDLPNGINGSDDMTITVIGTDSSTSVQITQAKYGNKTSLDIELPKAIITTRVKLSFTMTAGVPSFGDVSLWGDSVK
jgi:hypothetical protein